MKMTLEVKEDSTGDEDLALLGITKFVEEEEAFGSESDEEYEDDLVESYKEVRETLIRLGKDNVSLIKEKLRLEALVEALQTELHAQKKLSHESVSLIREKLILANKADKLKKELYAEKEVSMQLQSQLDLQYKKIHMFAGTKQLDKILSYGRIEKTHRGLGYTGQAEAGTEGTKFVSVGFLPITEQRSATERRPATVHRPVAERRPKTVHRPVAEFRPAAERRPVTEHKTVSSTVLKRGCYFCGKYGHIKKHCYKFWERVKRLRQQGKYTWNHHRNQIWVKKSDLQFTGTRRASARSSRTELWCNMASVSGIQDDTYPWYFDSGSSRHMTGIWTISRISRR